MQEMRHDVLLRLVKLFDAALITVPFAVCWYAAYAQNVAAPYYNKGNWAVIALFFVLYVTYGRIYEGFLVSIYRISEMVYSQALAALVSDGLMYVVIWLLSKHLPAVWPLLITFAMQLLLAGLWCTWAHQWYFRMFRARRTLVVYDQREGMDRLIHEYDMDNKFHIVKTMNVQQLLAGGVELLDGIETVFLCGVHSHDRNAIIKKCVARKVTAYVIPRIGDVLMSGAKQMHLFHLPMLRVTRYNPAPEYLLAKRVFDVVSSGLLLVVASPVMLAVAIAIKAADGGPVLYKQRRLTKDGKTFDVLKFRSMRVDAEKDGVARLSTGEKDDRVTPVGRVIRKVRLDELPQLFNIFVGDMSVVGPRPERPEIAAQYEKELPEFSLRLQVKAGLTGYAQVYGKYNTTPYDKLQMDLMYIAHPSFVEDLKIIFTTIKILFVPESTEGVQEGQVTAIKKAEGEWQKAAV